MMVLLAEVTDIDLERHRTGPARGRRAPVRRDLRHADRRRRGQALLLRPRRVGADGPGPEDDRGRPRDPPPRAQRVRGGRDRAGPRPAARVAHVRGRRRRADRRRARRPDRRDRPRHAAARLPPHRPDERPDPPRRGRRPRAARVPGAAVREGQEAARAARRDGPDRPPRDRHRRRGRHGRGDRGRRGAPGRAHRRVGGGRVGVAAGGHPGPRHRGRPRPHRAA